MRVANVVRQLREKGEERGMGCFGEKEFSTKFYFLIQLLSNFPKIDTFLH